MVACTEIQKLMNERDKLTKRTHKLQGNGYEEEAEAKNGMFKVHQSNIRYGPDVESVDIADVRFTPETGITDYEALRRLNYGVFNSW